MSIDPSKFKGKPPYICDECALLLREAGYKLAKVESWPTYKTECAHCGKKRHVYGVLEGLHRQFEMEGAW